VWFFKTILLIVWWSLSVIVDFCPLVLFAYVVFLWFVYADVTLETVTIDTCSNVADFVIDAPAKHTPVIYPLSKLDTALILWFFHTDCHSAQSLVHLHKHYRV
jgi:hypothetical protein